MAVADGGTVHGKDIRITHDRTPTGCRAWFFGPFQVVVDDRRLDEETWRRSSARTLLKWLLLNPGEPFGADHLSSLLWPDIADDRAAKNLSVTLHCLRHVLEPHLGARRQSTFIRSDDRKNYWFDTDGRWRTDVQDAQDLDDAARAAESRGEYGRAITFHERLRTIYERSFLPEDIYNDLFADFRHTHKTAHARTVQRLMILYLRTDQLPNALSIALDILAGEPCAPDAIKTVIEVHQRQGNVSGAIRQLDNFARRSEAEFGAPLDHELVALRGELVRAG